MYQFRFGSGCFQVPGAEESMEMMVASKMEYHNLSEFAESCLVKQWEWEHKKYYTNQSLEERLGLAVYRTAGEKESADLLCRLQSMVWVEIRISQIENIMVLFEPEWNAETYAFETDCGYCFVEWGTSV